MHSLFEQRCLPCSSPASCFYWKLTELNAKLLSRIENLIRQRIRTSFRTVMNIIRYSWVLWANNKCFFSFFFDYILFKWIESKQTMWIDISIGIGCNSSSAFHMQYFKIPSNSLVYVSMMLATLLLLNETTLSKENVWAAQSSFLFSKAVHFLTSITYVWCLKRQPNSNSEIICFKQQKRDIFSLFFESIDCFLCWLWV